MLVLLAIRDLGGSWHSAIPMVAAKPKAASFAAPPEPGAVGYLSAVWVGAGGATGTRSRSISQLSPPHLRYRNGRTAFCTKDLRDASEIPKCRPVLDSVSSFSLQVTAHELFCICLSFWNGYGSSNQCINPRMTEGNCSRLFVSYGVSCHVRAENSNCCPVQWENQDP
ncbi:hypothetical protein BJX63DRAFT_130490 [Aspergillus granulosus]|uniref:Uncharacterized protein n=1 Tax=Aspergillus granulosus TaxID=176169 RepID=A0ABR4HP26_9EURO